MDGCSLLREVVAAGGRPRPGGSAVGSAGLFGGVAVVAGSAGRGWVVVDRKLWNAPCRLARLVHCGCSARLIACQLWLGRFQVDCQQVAWGSLIATFVT